MKVRLLHCVVPVLCLASDPSSAFTPGHLARLKQRTHDLFLHGWHSYMDYGFPADEVRPVTCEPYGPDFSDPGNLRNDALGNVSLTLLDNLDTLIIMEQWDELLRALAYLKSSKTAFFDQNTTVQVFEASIRWLGGLLLAHLLLTDIDWSHDENARGIAADYDGFLLVMAYDLGLRLIPAYKTSTQLPLPRINLKYGLQAVPNHLNVETCTSGATTPFVEFSLLLRLTGDVQFELHTSSTFWKLWLLRLPLGLLPMSIDPLNNKWLDEITGIGALVDSFYEYALKGAILFDDDHLWSVFARSYLSLLTHLAQGPGVDGYTFFANVNIGTGAVALQWIDLLGAFWAGVQVLAGRLSDAVSSHLVYLKIWDHFDAIPERWMTQTMGVAATHHHQLHDAVPLEWYPLRPEFIESTYYLYRATKDPMYLQIGLRILHLFETRYKAPCGFAGVQDIRTGKVQNRMETFVLGELLKYLYLLFDDANTSYVHRAGMKLRNWVFSTEAHPLWYTLRLGAESKARFHHHLLELRNLEPTFHQAGPFESLWQKLRRSQNSMTDVIVKQDPQPVNERRLGPYLIPTSVDLDVCELAPRQFAKQESRFLSSGYFHWDKLFSPDEAFASTLVRPLHLQRFNESPLDHQIEISPAFAATYGMAAKNAKCPRKPTTYEQEYVLGKFSRPEDVEMFRVARANKSLPFGRHDLVMPKISGRVRLELLKPGTVDSTNVKVSREYIRRKHPEKYISRSAEVFRVNKINGVFVGKHRTVWTERAFLEQSTDTFSIAKNNNVYLQGRYVENLKAFTFPDG